MQLTARRELATFSAWVDRHGVAVVGKRGRQVIDHDTQPERRSERASGFRPSHAGRSTSAQPRFFLLISDTQVAGAVHGNIPFC